MQFAVQFLSVLHPTDKFLRVGDMTRAFKAQPPMDRLL
jgi:hypothetical protein